MKNENCAQSIPGDASQDHHHDRCAANVAFPLLNFRGQAAFNHTRRALQQVLDRGTRRLRPYPDFAQQVGWIRDPAERARARERLPEDRRTAFDQQQEEAAVEVRRSEVEHDRDNILVVPEWGGLKYPNSAWTYSLTRCRELAARGPAALLAG